EARNPNPAEAAQIEGEVVEHSQRALSRLGNKPQTAARATIPGKRRPDTANRRALLLRRRGAGQRRHSERGLRPRQHCAGPYGRRMDFAATVGASHADARPVSRIAAVIREKLQIPRSKLQRMTKSQIP